MSESDTLLEVKGLFAGYGRIEALHGVDLCVKQSQVVALIGANGAGKTTLLKAISGLIQVNAGQVLYAGRDITRDEPHGRVTGGIAQVLEGRQVFGALSVEDNLKLGAYTRTREAASRLQEMYELFPVLLEKRRQEAWKLSGGQQQMLAMARALMSQPRVLLLDEPSMGLAPLLVKEIFSVIARLRNTGVSILLVEQNARAALSIADVGYVLETGSIGLSGAASELLTDPRVRSLYLGM
jgi:branched-chain amino acid transport system ATP-binding protein